MNYEWFLHPLSKCCWKTTKIIYFFKIFVQKLHVILSFHSYHTYCMFGEVSYPKLANVQNKKKIVFLKKNEEEKNIYINIYISILYFTWSRVIFCRFFVYSQGDICIVKQQWWRKIKKAFEKCSFLYLLNIQLKFKAGFILANLAFKLMLLHCRPSDVDCTETALM